MGVGDGGWGDRAMEVCSFFACFNGTSFGRKKFPWNIGLMLFANNVRNRSTVLYHEASKFETFQLRNNRISSPVEPTNTIYNYIFSLRSNFRL